MAENVVPKRPSRFFGIKLIKLKFQFRFSLIILAVFTICALVVWLQERWALNQLISSGLVVENQAVENLQLLGSLSAKTALLSLVVGFTFLLIYSHYIAGPVYRFEKTLEEIQNGNISGSVRLRPWDEFKDVADRFTQALAGLRLKLKKDRDLADRVMANVLETAKILRQSGQADKADELERIINEFKKAEHQVKV